MSHAERPSGTWERTASRWWGVVVALLTSWAVSSAVVAQEAPPITRGMFEEHVRRLGLTNEADAAPAREVFERFANARQGEVERLLDRYFRDLRAAYPGDTARVDWLERAFYRRQVLGQGRDDSGNPPDLIVLVEEIAPNALEAPAAAVLLLHFEEAVHPTARPAYTLGRTTDFERERLIADRDLEGLTAYWIRRFGPRPAMREVVSRLAPMIAAALPEQDAERFRREYERRMYPAILRPTRIDVLIEAALARDDLGDEQRERIESLRTRLEARRASERRRLMAAEDAPRRRAPGAPDLAGVPRPRAYDMSAGAAGDASRRARRASIGGAIAPVVDGVARSGGCATAR